MCGALRRKQLLEAWESAEWDSREAQIRALQEAQIKEFEDGIKAKHAQVGDACIMLLFILLFLDPHHAALSKRGYTQECARPNGCTPGKSFSPLEVYTLIRDTFIDDVTVHQQASHALQVLWLPKQYLWKGIGRL